MRLLCCVAVAALFLATTGADDLPWWKTAIFYQVYPRSFMDSDGDGVGDLKGITQKADYFKEIGVNAIWLSPICQSPMADFGYDISNYTAIDPLFGTMDDFDDLVTKLRKIDVKLVFDFVPNHSSDEHYWFQQSLNSSSDYSDFYVWRDPSNWNGTTPLPPNNWISVMGPQSAWEWREERQQFYLHQFIIKQPDLNYRSEALLANMTAVVNFWLDKGVDGFRIDAIPYIYEDASYPNDPIVSGTDGSIYDDLEHLYDLNQPETFTLLRHWADVVYQRVLSDGRPRAIFLESYQNSTITRELFGTGNESLEFPFNFNLLSNGGQSSRPVDFLEQILAWNSTMPVGGIANWVIGNHDNMRAADRFGYEMVDAMNLLTGVLPGIKVVYNGEELGMQNTFVRWDQTVDPQGILAGESNYLSMTRDPERTPFQWDDSISAGFSNNTTPWLPVNPNYYWLNVEAQNSAKTSHLKVFKAMTEARKESVLMYGDWDVQVPNNDTLLVIRSYNGSKFVLIINMGSVVYDYTSQSLFKPLDLDVDLTVVVASVNADYSAGKSIKAGSLNISLRPKGAILLKTSGASRLLSSLFLTALLGALLTFFRP